MRKTHPHGHAIRAGVPGQLTVVVYPVMWLTTTQSFTHCPPSSGIGEKILKKENRIELVGLV